MRIFSKRAFQFDHPAGDQPAVFVRMQDFADLPDWVVDSLMFQLASKDGDVEVIGSRADEIAAETGTKAKTKAEKAAEAKAAAEAELNELQAKAADLQIPDADKLGRDELISAITAAGSGQQ